MVQTITIVTLSITLAAAIIYILMQRSVVKQILAAREDGWLKADERLQQVAEHQHNIYKLQLDVKNLTDEKAAIVATLSQGANEDKARAIEQLNASFEASFADVFRQIAEGQKTIDRLSSTITAGQEWFFLLSKLREQGYPTAGISELMPEFAKVAMAHGAAAVAAARAEVEFEDDGKKDPSFSRLPIGSVVTREVDHASWIKTDRDAKGADWQLLLDPAIRAKSSELRGRGFRLNIAMTSNLATVAEQASA